MQNVIDICIKICVKNEIKVKNLIRIIKQQERNETHLMLGTKNQGGMNFLPKPHLRCSMIANK